MKVNSTNQDSLTAGASFIRADLHIHSYGEDGSYDVDDSTMTPTNIVNEAIKNNLSIISITDTMKLITLKRQ